MPRTVDGAVEAISICREYDSPILSRGGGTNLAGQCTTAGAVIDWSKYCERVVSVDPTPAPASSKPGSCWTTSLSSWPSIVCATDQKPDTQPTARSEGCSARGCSATGQQLQPSRITLPKHQRSGNDHALLSRTTDRLENYDTQH